MDWKRIIGAAMFGSVPSFLQNWSDGMWPVGSWQWGVLTFASLFFGIALMTWNKCVVKNNGEYIIHLPAVRNALAWFFGFSIIVLFIWASSLKDWQWPEFARYEEVWVHPDRPQNRVMKDKNKCMVDAYEAFGPKPSLYTGYERNLAEYVNACMIGKGYVIKRIKQ